MIGESGSSTASSSFTLTLKNPCIDPNFVSISTLPQLRSYYTLYDDALIYAHTPFTVTTYPSEHSLCGPLIYLPSMDGGLLTTVTYPISYLDFSGELIVQT